MNKATRHKWQVPRGKLRERARVAQVQWDESQRLSTLCGGLTSNGKRRAQSQAQSQETLGFVANPPALAYPYPK